MTDDIVRIGALTLKFLIDDKASNGTMMLFEVTVPEQAKVPAPHYHREVDEAVYGLSGTLTFTVGAVAYEISAGQFVFVPRGVVHHFKNNHTGEARILSMLTPASIGKAFFVETAAVMNAGGPPDIEKVKAIMQRHGLVPAAG